MGFAPFPPLNLFVACNRTVRRRCPWTTISRSTSARALQRGSARLSPESRPALASRWLRPSQVPLWAPRKLALREALREA